MKKFVLSAVLGAVFAASLPVWADSSEGMDRRSRDPLTMAVIGDWPYGPVLFSSANLLINSVNADAKVKLLLHVGDIHSGSQPCTGAGLNPLPAGANPTYNHDVFNFLQQFTVPVVYTPGDNEWTDCHKKKQFSSGAPINELTALRGLFFANPGHTLGAQPKRVVTQAERFNRTFPADAQYVENVLWEQSGVVFATINLPGSNNDGLLWTAPFTDETARAREAAQRTGAALRWLRHAFKQADEDDAKGILIGLQANMWDTDQLVAGGDGLGNYTLFVHELANLSLRFKRPVLLINGDSHVFGSDQPLADINSVTGRIHGAPAVPNLTRVTVQGSTTAPAEWLRLTIDPRTAGIFSWEHVPYCQAPAVSCQ